MSPTETRAPAGFEVPDPIRAREARNYVNDIMSRESEEGPTGETVQFAVIADDSITNAYDYAVDQGFATVREGRWKGERIFEPVPPITPQELEDWAYVQAEYALPALLDSYGYDRDGKLYPHNRPGGG